MELSKKAFDHVAHLAHLQFEPQEAEKLRGQLSSVLEYVGKIGELKLTDVPPTAHITGVENVMRADEVKECDEVVRERLLDAAPAREGNYVKVKSVFGV